MNDSKKSLLFLHISVMLFGLSGVIGQFVDAPSVVVAGEGSSVPRFCFWCCALFPVRRLLCVLPGITGLSFSRAW